VKKVICATLLVLSAAVALAQLGSPSDSQARATTRSVTGTVSNASDAPVHDAIVYLKNTKTLAVKTFIADEKGQYRFHGLSPNVDYEIYADHKGKRSDTKTLSAFDNRAEAYINLKIK
jgi:protocatechuate 3,4-dioxygenase beta subunit